MSRWGWILGGAGLGALLLARRARGAVLPPGPGIGMLSEHFSEDEYFRGQEYDAALLANARYLARSVLEPLRAALGGRPMIVVSGYRAPERNRAVGGAEKSQHLRALAADVRVAGGAPRTIFDLADRMQRDGAIPPGGLGLYDTFTHVDARGYLARGGADGEERA